MTGQFEPEGATAARVDLGSFPQAGVAVVFGAGGGIGGALVEALKAAEKFKHVVSFSRSTLPAIDLLDEHFPPGLEASMTIGWVGGIPTGLRKPLSINWFGQRPLN